MKTYVRSENLCEPLLMTSSRPQQAKAVKTPWVRRRRSGFKDFVH